MVAQMVKNLPAMRKTQVQSLGWHDPLEKEMATCSSILAWEIPWTEEPGRLQSMGLQRVGQDLVTKQKQQTIHSNVEALNPRSWWFWRCSLWEVIKTSKVMRVGPYDGLHVLKQKRRDQSPCSFPLCTQQEGISLTARKRVLTGTESVGTLILGFQPPDCEQ